LEPGVAIALGSKENIDIDDPEASAEGDGMSVRSPSVVDIG